MIGAIIGASCFLLLWLDSILTRRRRYQRKIEELKEKLKEAQKSDPYKPSSWDIDSVHKRRVDELSNENSILHKLISKYIEEF